MGMSSYPRGRCDGEVETFRCESSIKFRRWLVVGLTAAVPASAFSYRNWNILGETHMENWFTYLFEYIERFCHFVTLYLRVSHSFSEDIVSLIEPYTM